METQSPVNINGQQFISEPMYPGAPGEMNIDDPTETWSVWRRDAQGERQLIEADLPKEIARDMVADDAAEGEAVWAEDSAAR